MIDGDVDHQPVGERVGVLPELRLDVLASREPTIHLVGDAAIAEDDGRRPAMAVVAARKQHHEDRHEREPRDRERVR